MPWLILPELGHTSHGFGFGKTISSTGGEGGGGKPHNTKALLSSKSNTVLKKWWQKKKEKKKKKKPSKFFKWYRGKRLGEVCKNLDNSALKIFLNIARLTVPADLYFCPEKKPWEACILKVSYVKIPLALTFDSEQALRVKIKCLRMSLTYTVLGHLVLSCK